MNPDAKKYRYEIFTYPADYSPEDAKKRAELARGVRFDALRQLKALEGLKGTAPTKKESRFWEARLKELNAFSEIIYMRWSELARLAEKINEKTHYPKEKKNE